MEGILSYLDSFEFDKKLKKLEFPSLMSLLAFVVFVKF